MRRGFCSNGIEANWRVSSHLSVVSQQIDSLLVVDSALPETSNYFKSINLVCSGSATKLIKTCQTATGKISLHFQYLSVSLSVMSIGYFGAQSLCGELHANKNGQKWRQAHSVSYTRFGTEIARPSGRGRESRGYADLQDLRRACSCSSARPLASLSKKTQKAGKSPGRRLPKVWGGVIHVRRPKCRNFNSLIFWKKELHPRETYPATREHTQTPENWKIPPFLAGFG